MDVNFEKLDDIGDMIKETDNIVTEMVTETTKWKNKGGKMKSYDNKMQGLKNSADMDFDESVSLALSNRKIDESIKYLNKKIKYNKRLLECME